MSGKLLGFVVALAACKGHSDAPHELRVDKLGVAVTVRGDWQVKPRSEHLIALTRGQVFVNLQPTMKRTSLAEARPAHVKIHEERALPSGGFLFVYDNTTLGGADTKIVSVTLPVGDAGVECLAPLHKGLEKHHQTLIDVCASLVAK